MSEQFKMMTGGKEKMSTLEKGLATLEETLKKFQENCHKCPDNEEVNA